MKFSLVQLLRLTRLRHALSSRVILIRLRPVFDEIFLPLKLISKGRCRFFIFEFFILLACFGIFRVTTFLINLIFVDIIPHLPAQYHDFVLQTGWYGSIYLIMPFIVVAIALPVRLIWITGSLPTLETLTQTIKCLILAFSTQRLIFAYLIRTCPILIIGIAIFYSNILASSVFTTQHLTMLKVVFFATILHAIWRSYPIVLASILAVCLNLKGPQAMHYCQATIRPRFMEIFSSSILAIGIIVAINKYCKDLVVQLPWISISLLTLASIYVTWHLLTYLTFVVIRSAVAKIS